MRSGLSWALGGSVAASAWVLVSGPPSSGSGSSSTGVAVAKRNEPPPNSTSIGLLPASAASAAAAAAFDTLTIPLATRDPFVSEAPADAPSPPDAEAPSAPAAPAASPAETAPTPDYRFVGRMLTPEGKLLTWLDRGNGSAIEITQGQRLEDGYVVHAIGSGAIQLVYPRLGTTVEIPIPLTEVPQ